MAEPNPYLARKLDLSQQQPPPQKVDKVDEDILDQLTKNVKKPDNNNLEMKKEVFRDEKTPDLDKPVEYKPKENKYENQLNNLKQQENARLMKLRNRETLQNLQQKNQEALLKGSQPTAYKRVMDDLLMSNKPRKIDDNEEHVLVRTEDAEKAMQHNAKYNYKVNMPNQVQNNNLESKTSNKKEDKASIHSELDSNTQNQDDQNKKKSLTKLMQEAQLEEKINQRQPEKDDILDLDDIEDFITLNNRQIKNVKIRSKKTKQPASHRRKNNKLRNKFRGV
jgi:hypothetical protein